MITDKKILGIAELKWETVCPNCGVYITIPTNGTLPNSFRCYKCLNEYAVDKEATLEKSIIFLGEHTND